MNTAFLTGKTALVTGAGSGIGQHLAKTLADYGAYVFLAGRQESSLLNTSAKIGRENRRSHVVATDIVNEESVAAMVGTVLARAGRLDIAVNAAGVLRTGTIDDIKAEDVRTVFSTNVIGTWLCLKHQIRAMKAGFGGTIINVASNVGYHMTRPGTSAYAASKAAITVLTKTAALEAIGSGIRINSISPGPVDTPMSYRPGEDRVSRDARIATTNPSKRVATLDEIAQCALWLCSDAAGYMVGHDLVIDGGASL